MPINFSTELFLPNFDTFARPITVNPVASMPGQPPYSARADDPGMPCRGIYDTRPIDVIGLDGLVTSDQKTELDVRDAEFVIVPMQRDIITIPAIDDIPALGDYEVLDSDNDGEGSTTLTLRKIVQASLP